jgi:hypothetical protein
MHIISNLCKFFIANKAFLVSKIDLVDFKSDQSEVQGKATIDSSYSGRDNKLLLYAKTAYVSTKSIALSVTQCLSILRRPSISSRSFSGSNGN